MILDRYEFIGFVDINRNRNCTSKSREYLGKERLIINYNIRINRRIMRQPKKKKELRSSLVIIESESRWKGSY